MEFSRSMPAPVELIGMSDDDAGRLEPAGSWPGKGKGGGELPSGGTFGNGRGVEHPCGGESPSDLGRDWAQGGFATTRGVTSDSARIGAEPGAFATLGRPARSRLGPPARRPGAETNPPSTLRRRRQASRRTGGGGPVRSGLPAHPGGSLLGVLGVKGLSGQDPHRTPVGGTLRFVACSKA